MIFNKNCRSKEVRIVDIQIDYGAIGKRIRSARMKMSMTQETLSNLIDVSPTYISTIENGHTKLSLPTLISIATALETTVDHLLYDNIPVLVSQYDAVLRQSVQIGSAVDSYVSSCPQFSGATYLDTGSPV